MKPNQLKLPLLLVAMISPFLAMAQHGGGMDIAGIRVEFILFGLTLLGGFVSEQTFWVAIIGLTVIVAFKLIFVPEYSFAHHFLGENSMAAQLADKSQRQGEWGVIVNLAGLLLALASLPKSLKNQVYQMYCLHSCQMTGRTRCIVDICIYHIFLLDNIAAAMIGGAIAIVVFNNKVHVGYIAALVAASNAGGSGSIVGDTTTTMMWIDGVSAFNVIHAYVAAVVALLIITWFAARQQDAYQRITKDAKPG